MSGYLSTREVADRLGLHPKTINRYCTEGAIPGAMKLPGGYWRIPESAIRAQGEEDMEPQKKTQARSCPHNEILARRRDIDGSEFVQLQCLQCREPASEQFPTKNASGSLVFPSSALQYMQRWQM